MTKDQIETIERLRLAAAQHGEVADLLDALDFCLKVEESVVAKRLVFCGNDEHVSLIQAAQLAAKFAAFDRKDA